MSQKKIGWISGNEAAVIMTRNAGHKVSTAYVRLLANQGKICSRAVNAREKEYHEEDVKNYIVERRGKETVVVTP